MLVLLGTDHRGIDVGRAPAGARSRGSRGRGAVVALPNGGRQVRKDGPGLLPTRVKEAGRSRVVGSGCRLQENPLLNRHYMCCAGASLSPNAAILVDVLQTQTGPPPRGRRAGHRALRGEWGWARQVVLADTVDLDAQASQCVTRSANGSQILSGPNHRTSCRHVPQTRADRPPRRWRAGRLSPERFAGPAAGHVPEPALERHRHDHRRCRRIWEAVLPRLATPTDPEPGYNTGCYPPQG
jgi:hypothetical protein